MSGLVAGDRLRIFGGYDQDPDWLQDGDGFYATVAGFVAAELHGRSGHERLSAVVEFDEVIEFDGLTGRYGVLTTRYVGQRWEYRGNGIHVHLVNQYVTRRSDMTSENSRWMESHASYERL